jgi:hypothetical protein
VAVVEDVEEEHTADNVSERESVGSRGRRGEIRRHRRPPVLDEPHDYAPVATIQRMADSTVLENWTRRRDLEGGKELCVWLSDHSEEELYVESHRYRGGDYDAFVTDADDNWNHLGEYEAVTDAIDAAME